MFVLNVNVKVVPIFTSLSISIVPPIVSTCDFTKYRPSPLLSG
jgi:hypothetical protein